MAMVFSVCVGLVCEKFILFVYIQLFQCGFADGYEAHSVFRSVFVSLSAYRPKRARFIENGLCGAVL